MPKFAYAAIDTAGASIEGVTKADTIGAARAILVQQNLFPTKIEERRGKLDFELTKEKVKKKHLMHFTRQLAVFVKAGIPITDALITIGDETEDVALRRALGVLVDDLRNGGLLSAAAATHPEVFPDYYVGILQSAELTGQLDVALENLAEYLEREIDTQSKVVSALSYPMVVMVMAGVTVLILAGYVLPQFKPLFEELGADLPLPTRAMLFFSRFFTDLWFITAAFFAVIAGSLMFLFKHPTGKLWKERLVLKIPIIKGIVDYAILERFCRILSAMLAAGVPCARGHLGDEQDDATLTGIADQVEPGHDPSVSLREFVLLRDRGDDGPTGTRTPAVGCHLDHTVPYPHGPTAAWNLAVRGRRTHQLKHYGWIPLRTPTTTIWTSPAGQLVEVPRHTTPPPGVDPDPHGQASLPDPDELDLLDRAQLEAPTDDHPPWLPHSERDTTTWTWLTGPDDIAC